MIVGSSTNLARNILTCKINSVDISYRNKNTLALGYLTWL